MKRFGNVLKRFGNVLKRFGNVLKRSETFWNSFHFCVHLKMNMIAFLVHLKMKHARRRLHTKMNCVPCSGKSQTDRCPHHVYAKLRHRPTGPEHPARTGSHNHADEDVTHTKARRVACQSYVHDPCVEPTFRVPWVHQCNIRMVSDRLHAVVPQRRHCPREDVKGLPRGPSGRRSAKDPCRHVASTEFILVVQLRNPATTPETTTPETNCSQNVSKRFPNIRFLTSYNPLCHSSSCKPRQTEQKRSFGECVFVFLF